MNNKPFEPKTAFEGFVFSEINHLKKKLDDIKNNHLPTLYGKVDKLKEKMAGRPSWIVAILITALTSLCVGLIVQAIMRGGG